VKAVQYPHALICVHYMAAGDPKVDRASMLAK